MNKYIKQIVFIPILLLWVSATFGVVNAASLKFDKSSYSVAVGETFSVELIVSPGSEQITSVDAYFKYESNVIDALSVTKGTYFPTVLDDLTTGNVYVAGLVDAPSDYKTGTGTVAKISFKALKEGETDLIFDCDGDATVTSKIIKNDINSTDIIQCSENGTATVIISVGGGESTEEEEEQEEVVYEEATPTPTPTIVVVTQLPATGSTENMMTLALIGAILVGVGGVAKLIRRY